MCCVACAREPGKGKHTRYCEANQAMRLQKNGNALGGVAAADGPPAKLPAEPPAEPLAEPPVTSLAKPPAEKEEVEKECHWQ